MIYEPNVGFEQALFSRRLTLRFGVDETAPTAGLSLKIPPFNLDIAYVRNMARSRWTSCSVRKATASWRRSLLTMAPFIVATENEKRVRDTSSNLRDPDPVHAISGTVPQIRGRTFSVS